MNETSSKLAIILLYVKFFVIQSLYSSYLPRVHSFALKSPKQTFKFQRWQGQGSNINERKQPGLRHEGVVEPVTLPTGFKRNLCAIQFRLLPHENKGPMISGLLTFSRDIRNFDFFLCNFLNTFTSCMSNKTSLWVEYGLWATSLQLLFWNFTKKINSMFRFPGLREQKTWKVSVQTGAGP